MTDFTIHQMQDASILALDNIRDRVKIDPDYQRPGGVWSRKKKQLFIDSLLNGYDIPKFYFHHLTGVHKSDVHQYAIIDGRQRLEAIWQFVDGTFALADDFLLLSDATVQVGGLRFKDLEKDNPQLLRIFYSRSLSIMVVTADDLDFIEDMFSRLNEAVPLNAAEKRNALGGPLPLIIQDLVHHEFFRNRIKVSSSRYRHHDLAAKLLYEESNGEIVDTKRASLDYFVESNRSAEKDDFDALVGFMTPILSEMANVFIENDDLLRSTGMIVVYYVLFANLTRDGHQGAVHRDQLVEFEAVRRENRARFSEERDGVDFKLIEFDELAQSSNDGAAIKQRYEVLRQHLNL